MADSTMSGYGRAEIEAAWAEYQRRGVGEHDWPGWADMFTDDARYEEHFLGVFEGKSAITKFIVDVMKEYPAMTLWIDWSIIDGDRIGFYIWNNLPDPTGEGKRFGFPNTTFITYAGDGKWSEELDFYNPPQADKAVGAWMKAGGRLDMAQDRSLKGIEGWNPEPPEPAFPREEVEAEFLAYRERGKQAVATGDWVQWADQFTDDAEYREHHYGYFKGKQAITDWITGVMQPFPTMEFPVKWALIDGNRVSALIPNILPPPDGDDGYYGFDVNTILHYAGNGKWSFEEDMYSVKAAEETVKRWLAAGGVIPS
jgi:predicted SnoaL-like aldol condensation-catalyzing enzyme